MRIITHVGCAMAGEAVDAVRDVLASLEGRRDQTRAWTRGWRGTATLVDGELVVDAGRRNSAGRRRIRISAGPEAAPPGRDPAAASASERLRMLADVLVDPAAALVPAEELAERDEALRNRLTFELGSNLPHDGWVSALVRPGSSRTPPRVSVRRVPGAAIGPGDVAAGREGRVVELGDAAAGPEWRMPETVLALLTDDAPHLRGVQAGHDVVLRLGTAPPFRCMPEMPYTLLGMQAAAAARNAS